MRYCQRPKTPKRVRIAEKAFQSDGEPLAPAGVPLTIFRDSASGSEYHYALLVPPDSHRLFPCFDQPDIKARFVLELTAPAAWTLVANQPPQGEPVVRPDGRVVQRFDETPPLPTYLFAFAAGPFAVLEAPAQPGAPLLEILAQSIDFQQRLAALGQRTHDEAPRAPA